MNNYILNEFINLRFFFEICIEPKFKSVYKLTKMNYKCMKRIFFLLTMTASAIILSCNKKSNENHNNETSKNKKKQPTINVALDNKFDIERIPYSTADLGEFPFFTLPKGLIEMNKPLKKNFDVCFFQ